MRTVLDDLLGEGATDKYFGWYQGGQNVTMLPFQDAPVREPSTRAIDAPGIGRFALPGAYKHDPRTGLPLSQPGRWAPAAFIGDTLGALGSTIKMVGDEALGPAYGAALALDRSVPGGRMRPTIGALMDASGWLSGGEAGTVYQEPPKEWTRANLNEYLSKSTPGLIPGLAREIAKDFTTPFGGPVKNLPAALARKGATAGVARPAFDALAKAVAPVAAVDTAYMAVGAAATNFAKEAAPAVLRVPYVGKLFQASRQAKAQDMIDKATGGFFHIKRNNQNPEDIFGRLRPRAMLDVGAGKALKDKPDLAAMTREAWLVIEDFMRTADPAQARVILPMLDDHVAWRNNQQRLINQRLAAGRSQVKAGTMTRDDLAALREELWTPYQADDAETARTIQDMIAEVKTTPFSPMGATLADEQANRDVLARLADTGFAESTKSRWVAQELRVLEQLTGAVERVKPGIGMGKVLVEQFTKKFDNLGLERSTLWTTPGAPGLLSPKQGAKQIADEMQRAFGLDKEGRLAVERTVLTHWALRTKAGRGSDYAVHLMQGVPGGTMTRELKDRLEDYSYSRMREGQLKNIRGAITQLDQGTDPLHDAITGAPQYESRYQQKAYERGLRHQTDPATGKRLRGYEGMMPVENAKALQTVDGSIRDAANAMLLDQAKISKLALDYLDPIYTARGMDDAAKNAVYQSINHSRIDLLQELTKEGMGDIEKGKIRAILDKYGQQGDVLDPDTYIDVLQHQAGTRIMKAEGDPKAPAWTWPFQTMVGLWVNQALLSPRYPLGDLLGGVIMASNAKLSVGDIMKRMGEGLTNYKDIIWKTGLNGERIIDWRASEALQLNFGRETMPITGPLGLYDKATGLTTLDPEFNRGLTPRHLSGLGDAPGLPGEATTMIGKIGAQKMAIGLGVAGGLQGAMSAPEDERLEKGLGGLAAGAAFGAISPTFARHVQLWSTVTNRALRGTAKNHGMTEAARTEIPQLLDDLMAKVGPGPDQRVTGIGATHMARARKQSPLAARPTFPTRPANRDAIFQALAGMKKEFEAGNLDDVDVSTLGIHKLFTTHGFDRVEANDAAQMASETTQRILDAGNKLVNKINFDYGKPTTIERFLRNTGLMPFVTWQARAAPIFASMLMTDPRWVALINALADISEEDVAESGLTGRFRDMVNTGKLASWAASAALGRGGEMFLNPLTAIFPFEGAMTPGGGEGYPSKAPLDPVMDKLRDVGLGPSPLYTLPMEAAGVISPRGNSSLFDRLSGYVGMLSTPAGSVDINAPVQAGVRAIRQAHMGPTANEPTVTGNPVKDYQIRARIAEIAVEETGRAPAGPYFQALKGDINNPIWRQATRDVDRQEAGRRVVQSTLPIRASYLSDTERQIREAALAQGTSPQQLVSQPDLMKDHLRARARLADSKSQAFEFTSAYSGQRTEAEAALVATLAGKLPPDMQAAAWEKYRAARGLPQW